MSRAASLQNRFYDALRSGAAKRAAEGEAEARGFDHLKGHSYCLVVSYKRSGEAVPTPVWFGLADDGRLYFRTADDALKVRRIRNNPAVRIAPCTTRGRPKGPAAEGRARVLSDDEFDRAEEAIQSNYGLGRKMYDGVAARLASSAYVEVTPS